MLFFLCAVPDLFVDSRSDRLRRLPNDDQRVENGCAYNLRHRLLDCRPFCQRFPFRSRRQFTPTNRVSSRPKPTLSLENKLHLVLPFYLLRYIIYRTRAIINRCYYCF